MIENSQLTEIAHNIMFLKEASRVVLAFEQENVPVLLLKGIALVEMVYPHIGMRAMTDIDLLIKEKDTPLASQRLLDLGYELKPGITPPTYTRKGHIPITIELHNTRMPYLSEKELWDNLMPVINDGVEGYTLSLEQNIIYLCYHLAVSHANSQQKWLEDIHRIVTHFREEIDWHELRTRIKKYRLEAPCYYTILKTKEVFQSHIPDYFLSSIKPKNSLKAKIFEQIFIRSEPIPHVPRVLPFLINPKLIFTRLFPSRRFLCLRYGTRPPLVYFYYLMRPACLILKAMTPCAHLLLMLLRNVIIIKKTQYKELVKQVYIIKHANSKA